MTDRLRVLAAVYLTIGLTLSVLALFSYCLNVRMWLAVCDISRIANGLALLALRSVGWLPELAYWLRRPDHSATQFFFPGLFPFAIDWP